MFFIVETLVGIDIYGEERVNALKLIGVDENFELVCLGPFITSQIGFEIAIHKILLYGLLSPECAIELYKENAPALPRESNVDYIQPTANTDFYLVSNNGSDIWPYSHRRN